MGFEVTGYDIIKEQIRRSKTNLDHYGIKKSMLEVRDATMPLGKSDAIVTDLPYGKGSVARDPEQLYLSFFRNAEQSSSNLIAIVPDFMEYEKIIAMTKWKVLDRFKVFVHKSLTRNILKMSL